MYEVKERSGKGTALTVEMLDAEFILVLELLDFFLRCLLVMLLILLGGLNSFVDVLANKKDLAVWIVEVFGLDLAPSQVTKLFDDSADD